MSLTSSPSPIGHDSICQLDPLANSDWDTMVSALPGAGFFHTSAWANVLKSTYGYTPAYFTKNDAGRLQAMLPLMEVDSWITGRRGVSLPFSDSVEPLAADADSYHALINAALVHAKERKWKHLECRGGKQWMSNAPASTAFLSHHLSLQADDSALFKRFDKGVRSAVHKGERSGLAIEFSQSSDAMKVFYSLHSQTRRRHGVPPQPFSFFSNIQSCALAKDLGWIVTARLGQVPVASAVFLHFGGTVIYKFGASNETYQQLRANNLVLWRAIQWYAQKSFASFDFGRTDLSNHGLRQFKRGWGTTETRSEYVTYDCRNPGYKPARDESSDWHTRVFNMLPMSFSRIIGTALYRHLG